MAKKNKQKRVQEIADELDGLGYPGIAQMLRDAVTSGKTNSNEQSESNEGDEGNDGGIEVPKKPPPPQP